MTEPHPPSGRTDPPGRLLDVNVLLALMWDQHVHHTRARRTFASLTSFATTPITEAGTDSAAPHPGSRGPRCHGS